MLMLKIPNKIKYWVHFLFEFDPVNMKNKVIKGYVQQVKVPEEPKEQKPEEKEPKKVGEITL